MKRHELFDLLLPVVDDDLVITSLGGNARSWYARRPRNNYIVHHAMGLTTAVGLGLALSQPTERIWVFEGDGGMLMNLGMLAVIGKLQPANLIVIIVDNEIFESGGSVPTLSGAGADLAAIAEACGCRGACTIRSERELRAELNAIHCRPAVLVVKVESAADGEPLRIEYTENRMRFAEDVELKLGITLRQPAEYYSRPSRP